MPTALTFHREILGDLGVAAGLRDPNHAKHREKSHHNDQGGDKLDVDLLPISLAMLSGPGNLVC
jgi:hypothetical protein